MRRSRTKAEARRRPKRCAKAGPHLAAAGFEIDLALQGKEGLQRVQQALAEGRPYAMAFIDVRMPPGWDGIETTGRIWRVDPDLQVVICTACSDYPWGRDDCQNRAIGPPRHS